MTLPSTHPSMDLAYADRGFNLQYLPGLPFVCILTLDHILKTPMVILHVHGKTILLAVFQHQSSSSLVLLVFIRYCLDLPVIGLQNGGGNLYSAVAFFHVMALEEIFLSSTVIRSKHETS